MSAPATTAPTAEEVIAAALAAAPPLTDEQADRIASLLRDVEVDE